MMNTVNGWSCTSPLRIIVSPRKPSKMPQLNSFWRGQGHGVTSVLLPTRAVGHHMALRHVVSHRAPAKRDPDYRPSHAHHAQAQAFDRAQSVRGSDAQASL